MNRWLFGIPLIAWCVVAPATAQSECDSFRYAMPDKVSELVNSLSKISEYLTNSNYKAACSEGRALVANAAAVRKELDARKGQCGRVWQQLVPSVDQLSADGKQMSSIACK